jgi:hypothetical protein
MRMVLDFGRRLDRIAKEGLKDLRKLLPAGRGGSGPQLGGDEGIIAPTTRPVTPKPLPKTVIPGNPQASIGRKFAESAQLRQEAQPMTTREEVIQMLVNDPLLEITENMLPIINDPSILMNGNGELVRNQFAEQFRRDKLLPKPKRKVSKYQKELGRQLKMLKKKHPRTKVTALMKRAHRLTRKALK